MIEPSKGRDDLEYRYHVKIETWALLDAEQQEHFRNGPDLAYLGDPDFSSEYPDLDWVKVTTMAFARRSAQAAGQYIYGSLGLSLSGSRWQYHLADVLHIEGKVLCRSIVMVRHEAAVPDIEWQPENTAG